MLALPEEDLLAQRRLTPLNTLLGASGAGGLPTAGGPAIAPTYMPLEGGTLPTINIAPPAPPAPTIAPMIAPTAGGDLTAKTATLDAKDPAAPAVAPRVPVPNIAPPAPVAPPITAQPPAPVPVAAPAPGALPPGLPTPNPGPPPDIAGAAGPPEAISDFGPGNDLRYSQINPVDNARLTRLNDLVDQSTGRIASSPDITQAGLDKLKLLEDQTAEARTLGSRDIGRDAARLGRLGSGVVTTDLGNLEDRLQTNLSRARTGLASDLTMQEAADRRANTGVLATLQDQLFGQGAAKRNELRGERGYEYGVGTDAYNRAVQQRQLEEDLKNSQFGREATAAQLGLAGAGQYDTQAADSQSAAADLMAQLAAYNARGLTARPKSSAPSSSTTPAAAYG